LLVVQSARRHLRWKARYPGYRYHHRSVYPDRARYSRAQRNAWLPVCRDSSSDQWQQRRRVACEGSRCRQAVGRTPHCAFWLAV